MTPKPQANMTIDEQPTEFTVQRLATTEEMMQDKSQQMLNHISDQLWHDMAELLNKDKRYALQTIPNDEPRGVLQKIRLFVFTPDELKALITDIRLKGGSDE